ncbi:antitoxin ParD1/3/4 [Variovorax sp. HW608]|uniref:type II toxin-antitoxin system ParD family antitoxin n=1 Tax=Variovorax sp. HW608 TaxID=1034889 RepID=UPI00082010DF|nr:type II toxin-antitoxin system ParD family antitoxin [Variovorax sp. HW608]SCK42289.1 antitoxin ParD1/3/4 [Variovorax sp. HW608]
MSTMNVSLPDAMKAFVDEQVAERGYGTSSEYVRELIRKDQQRLQLRNLLFHGGRSAPAAEADQAYFDGLRERVRNAGKKADRAAGKR